MISWLIGLHAVKLMVMETIDEKEILEAAEANAMNYCIQRGLVKSAFIDGALWAMKYCREIMKKALEAEDVES